MASDFNRKGIIPQFYVREDVALATADTVVNTTILSSPTGSTDLVKPVVFHPGPCRITIGTGNTTNTVFAVLRKVPEGYTAPSITIGDGNTTFKDVPDVLMYGIVRVYGGTSDVMQRIDLRMLRSSIPLARGDSIVLQVVSNTSSVNQVFGALVEYSTT